MADEKYLKKGWESPGLHGENLGAHDGKSGAEFPKLLYKPEQDKFGNILTIQVADAEAEQAAREDGWGPHPSQAKA